MTNIEHLSVATYHQVVSKVPSLQQQLVGLDGCVGTSEVLCEVKVVPGAVVVRA